MKPTTKNILEYSFCIENARFTLLYDTGFVSSLSTVPKPQERTLFHFHEYCELVYCTGATELSTPDFTTHHSAGDVIIIPPKTLHKIKTSGKNIVVSFALKNQPCKTDLDLFNRLNRLLLKISSFKATDSFSKTVLRFDINSPDTVVGDKLSMSLLFHQLVTHIIKAATPSPDGLDKACAYDSDESRIYKLNMIICTCYHQDITMQYVANKLSISVRQLSRVIKSSYNCTFREVITRFRMQEAIELLKIPDYSISAIASDVGYNSTKGFETAFKKYYNVVPTKYRKRNS